MKQVVTSTDKIQSKILNQTLEWEWMESNFGIQYSQAQLARDTLRRNMVQLAYENLHRKWYDIDTRHLTEREAHTHTHKHKSLFGKNQNRSTLSYQTPCMFIFLGVSCLVCISELSCFLVRFVLVQRKRI